MKKKITGCQTLSTKIKSFITNLCAIQKKKIVYYQAFSGNLCLHSLGGYYMIPREYKEFRYGIQ